MLLGSRWTLLATPILAALLAGGTALLLLTDREPGHLVGSAGPGLHLVFQKADCPEARRALDGLVRDARRRGLPVFATILDGSVGDPEDPFGVEREPPNPVELRRDSRGRVARTLVGLGFRETPVILLVDGAGRLRASLPGDLSTPGSITPQKVVSHAEAILQWEP